MSETLTQEEIIKNEDNHTVSPLKASAYAVRYAKSHLESFGVDVIVNDELTRCHQPGQLSLSVKAKELHVGLRANAVYLHNPAGMVTVPSCADNLDLLIVVTPHNPSSIVTDKRFLFIPRWRFLGKTTLYINRSDKIIWRGPDALLSIATKCAKEYEAQQLELLRKLAGKKISKASSKTLAKTTSSDVSQGVQEFINFELFPEIV